MLTVYEAVDTQGRDFLLTDLNTAGQRIREIDKHDVLGKSVLQVFPSVKACGLFEVFQRVFPTDTPEQAPTVLYEDQRLSQWVDNAVYKLPTGEIVAVYDDVTKQKNAEQALKNSEQRYNAWWKNRRT